MQKHCDYFYQLNDDIIFQGDSGWSTAFIKKLETQGNIGVVGPLDGAWRHDPLLTQAFVHRAHFLIFEKFYPFGIRNWYSDSWITSVPC